MRTPLTCRRRVALMAFALLAGCAGGNDRQSETGLSAGAIENGTYRSDVLAVESFTLIDGYFEDAERQTTVHLSEMQAFGDLTGDGSEDAVVILVGNSGGSGIFHEMAVVVNERGSVRHLTSTLLGDRVEVRSLAIIGDEILLDVTTHGPNDPLCCPTQDVTERYRLEGDRLVLVESDEAAPPSVL